MYSFIRYDDYRPLLLVLKIVSSMWKRKLQDIDITNDIIEVLVQTFESKMIQDIFDADFIIVICDLLCHVTIDRDQSKVSLDLFPCCKGISVEIPTASWTVSKWGH